MCLPWHWQWPAACARSRARAGGCGEAPCDARPAALTGAGGPASAAGSGAWQVASRPARRRHQAPRRSLFFPTGTPGTGALAARPLPVPGLSPTAAPASAHWHAGMALPGPKGTRSAARAQHRPGRCAQAGRAFDITAIGPMCRNERMDSPTHPLAG
jgi:hypothetical protein